MALYNSGFSVDHNLGDFTIAFSLNSNSPFALIFCFDDVFAISTPLLFTILLSKVIVAEAPVSFSTLDLIFTLADETLTSGVVMKVPHCDTWIGLVSINQTWRLIPEPAYQRLFAPTFFTCTAIIFFPFFFILSVI